MTELSIKVLPGFLNTFLVLYSPLISSTSYIESTSSPRNHMLPFAIPKILLAFFPFPCILPKPIASVGLFIQRLALLLFIFTFKKQTLNKHKQLSYQIPGLE